MAREMVRAPNLPKNINKITVILPPTERNGVTPLDNPTVPKAETASNNKSKKGEFSKKVKSSTQKKIKNIEKIKITIARFNTVKGISFLNSSILFLPRITDQTPAKRTARVVVLIPPPVEPGEAPINIKNRIKKELG